MAAGARDAADAPAAERYPARLEVWPWPADGGSAAAVAEWFRRRYGVELSEAGAQRRGARLADGRLTVDVEMARGGVSEFLERDDGVASLLDRLREAGLSFRASDEGCGEHEGCELSWRPGLEGLRERSVLVGGEVALSAGAATELLNEFGAGTVEERLRNYFAPLEDYREPAADADSTHPFSSC